jgi:hypothetical protein
LTGISVSAGAGNNFFTGEMKMKNLKRLGPALVLGLTIAVAGVSFAQSANPATSDGKHSCCCMSSGCCGDSCQMKKNAMKNHATSSDTEGCCGCCGDSFQKKDAAKNHVTSAKEGCCSCCGDSCQVMKKEGARNHATSAPKGCCGDSCHMKGGATAKANAASDKHQCCCCGDSCNIQHMKHAKDMKEKS